MDDPAVRNTRKNVLDGGVQNLVPTDAPPRPACWPNALTLLPSFGTQSEASVLKLPAPRPVAPNFFIMTMHATALDNRRSGPPSSSNL